MDCRGKLLRKLFVRKGLFSRLIQFLEIPAGSPTPSPRRESSQGNEAPLGQHSRRNDQCQSIHAVWSELSEERRPYYPNAWRFQVPPNHVVMGPETTRTTAEASSPLVIVSKEQIGGRAWARYYPFW